MRLSTFGFLTKRGLRNLGTHWAMTMACVASLTVCMTLNTAAALVEVNVGSMVSYLGSQNETVVYIDPDAPEETAASVGEQLASIDGVTGVTYVSKQDFLEIYRSYMEEEYASLWDEFETDNPFKASYRVSVSDLERLPQMSEQMAGIEGVYKVTAPVELTDTFVEIQQAVTQFGHVFALVLMAVSVITVGSSIRLSVFARRREIEIMKYVGATNALVTLPFLIEGLATGFISGALASGITIGGYGYLVDASAGSLSGIMKMLIGTSIVPLANVWPTILQSCLLGGTLVGGLGSLFSIRKHLNV